MRGTIAIGCAKDYDQLARQADLAICDIRWGSRVEMVECKEAKPFISLTAVLATVTLLIGASGCQSESAPPIDAPTPYQLYIQSMRDKYHGDPTKLTPEERKTMDRYTFHHTDAAMRYVAKPIKRKAPGSAKVSQPKPNQSPAAPGR